MQAKRIPPRTEAMTTRFWAKVRKGDVCWTWQASKTPLGYGMFQVRPHGNFYAHRLAYEWLVGPIPEGLELDHLCRNPSCLKPDHLEPVTHRENLLRGKGFTGWCKFGHRLEGDNISYVNRSSGKQERRCRPCHARRAREAKAKKRGVIVNL